MPYPIYTKAHLAGWCPRAVGAAVAAAGNYYYPNYSTRRSYFGEVETLYSQSGFGHLTRKLWKKTNPLLACLNRNKNKVVPPGGVVPKGGRGCFLVFSSIIVILMLTVLLINLTDCTYF